MTGHKVQSIYSRYSIADESMRRDGGARPSTLRAKDAAEARVVVPITTARSATPEGATTEPDCPSSERRIGGVTPRLGRRTGGHEPLSARQIKNTPRAGELGAPRA